MKKIYLILLCLLSIGFSVQAQDSNVEKENIKIHENTSRSIKTDENMILEIDFQDFFENDTVSLTLDSCLIFKNMKITSNSVLGLVTSISIQVYRVETNIILVKYNKSDTYCYLDDFDKIKIKIVINGKENQIPVNLDNGKYIGLSKGKSNKVDAEQSKFSFGYD